MNTAVEHRLATVAVVMEVAAAVVGVAIVEVEVAVVATAEDGGEF